MFIQNKDNMSCPIIKLAKNLIQLPSISPYDAGCQEIIINRLKYIGFIVEQMNFGKTFNFWAYRGCEKERTLAFAGHTDVVPIGDIKLWKHHPFAGIVQNGILYGRGSADMKGSLSAMIVATERFVTKYPNHKGRLSFIITSDEESIAKDGTAKVVEVLISRKERLNYCLIGEPTSQDQVGDIIKNGRRGSITANLVINGIQGHVGYSNLLDNPVHKAISILKELTTISWDYGNIFFPPTTMHITNINAGTGSPNITPSDLKVQMNFRFSSELTYDLIIKKVNKIIQKYGVCYNIDWSLSGNPFITKSGKLLNTVMHSVEFYQKIKPRLETTGGTSDGRFIYRMGAQIVELGPVNKTIHKVNECVSIYDLQILSNIYQLILENILL